MLRASTPLLRLTGLSFVLNRGSLLRRVVVATPQCEMRLSFFSTGAPVVSPFGAPLASFVRRSSTTARSSQWRLSRMARSWRERRASSSPTSVKRQKIKSHIAVPSPRNQSKVPSAKTRKKVHGSAQKKRVSAHQRQAMKYNKRVEAIARLWKEQQQQQKPSARKGVQKPLSSRLK